MAVVGANEPGIVVAGLDQIGDFDALDECLWVVRLHSQHNLLRQLEHGAVDPLVLAVGHLLLVKILVLRS